MAEKGMDKPKVKIAGTIPTMAPATPPVARPTAPPLTPTATPPKAAEAAVTCACGSFATREPERAMSEHFCLKAAAPRRTLAVADFFHSPTTVGSWRKYVLVACSLAAPIDR